VVIAISASVFDFNQQQSQEVGCSGFLPKPFREADLLEQLRVHLGLEWVYDKPIDGKPEGEDANPNSTTPWQHVSLGVMRSDRDEGASAFSPGVAGRSPVQGQENSKLIAPPAEEIAALLDLAMRNDLRGIVKRTAQLEELDQQWVPFTTHLRQLAKGFKGKQIREFLKQY
jgi:hypothetical protein